MTNTALLKHYAAYDLWANQRFINRSLNEDDTLLDREAPGSFPSLRATILHIRDAEHVWLCRLKGVPHSWPAEASKKINSLLAHCERLVELIHSDDLDPMKLISYADLRGNIHRQPAWELVMHCFNHSSQHRGQLITMMRYLGMADIPPNDMVVFQRGLRARA